MALTQVRRDAVVRALDEFDQLGRAAFLAKYGFGQATKFMFLRDGKAYDSKAILGAAHGFAVPADGPLRPVDFSGGEGHSKTRLEALGFEVTNAAAPLALTQGATEAERTRRDAMWRR